MIFAETLADSGVRFVFLVPAEEFQIEEADNLLSGEWRPLPDDEFKMIRENNVDSQDRLAVILEGEFLPREAIFLFSFAF